MNQPKSPVAGGALLFEKLTDLTPGDDDRDQAGRSEAAMRDSIRCELSRLLDSRLPWAPAAAEDPADWRQSTVTAYGIPDLTHLCLRKMADRAAIERLITTAIRNFEPRLIDPEVRILASPHQDRARLQISGAMRGGRALEPLSFELDTRLRMSDRGQR